LLFSNFADDFFDSIADVVCQNSSPVFGAKNQMEI
jgi:hypothetical protein